jgi:Flp pilus assembly protein TadG
MKSNVLRKVRNYSQGQIVILVAVSLVALIGMVGLAIDSGRAYGVNAKLSSAVDAAAVAAARALSQGATDADRIAAANAAGVKYYSANFPNDYLGATRNAPSIQVQPNYRRDHAEIGYWTVNVSGSANMPVTFLKVLGVTNTVGVGSAGQAVKRDVDVMLVLDTSGSLATPSNALPTLKTAATNCFINKFTAGPGGDRLGFVSFASGAELNVLINKDATRGFDKTAVTNAITNIPAASGSTAQAEAMRVALGELDAIPAALRSSLRAIVFFSDGAPNDVTATFDIVNTTITTNAVTGTQMGDLYSENYPGPRNVPNSIYPNNVRNGNPFAYPVNRDVANYFPSGTAPFLGFGGTAFTGQRTLQTVSGTDLHYKNEHCNVNKAARNMVENIANTARGGNIIIYTVGEGVRLNSNEVTNCGYGATEYGANILNRLANTATSDTYKPAQPTGMYLYAENIDGVCAAFSTIAAQLIRLY